MALAIFALALICIGSVSAAEDIQEGNLTVPDNSQISELNGGDGIDDVAVEDSNVDAKSKDVLKASEEDVLGEDSTLTIVSGSTTPNVGDTVYLKMSNEASTYLYDFGQTVYIRNDGTEYATTTYRTAISDAGAPVTFESAGTYNIQFCVFTNSANYYTNSITFTVAEGSASNETVVYGEGSNGTDIPEYYIRFYDKDESEFIDVQFLDGWDSVTATMFAKMFRGDGGVDFSSVYPSYSSSTSVKSNIDGSDSAYTYYLMKNGTSYSYTSNYEIPFKASSGIHKAYAYYTYNGVTYYSNVYYFFVGPAYSEYATTLRLFDKNNPENSTVTYKVGETISITNLLSNSQLGDTIKDYLITRTVSNKDYVLENLEISLNGEVLYKHGIGSLYSQKGDGIIVNPNDDGENGFSLSFDEPGWYNLTAKYYGNDLGLLESTSETLCILIKPDKETVTPEIQIELDKTSVSKDENVTVTVNVNADGNVVNEGTVEFYDEDNNKIGEIDLSEQSSFEYVVSGEKGTSHQIWAKYLENVELAYAEASSDKKEYAIKKSLTIDLARNGDGIIIIGDTVQFTITFSDSVSDNLELWVNDVKLGGEDGSASTSITFDEGDVGENNVSIKFLGNDEYEATQSNIVTVDVIKPMETTVTVELNPSEVLSSNNITVIPTVKDENGNVLTTGTVKVYNTQYYQYSDPILTISAGETGNFSDSNTYPGNSAYLYAIYIPSDKTYKQSSISAGAKYTILNSNKVELTVNGASEITVEEGVAFDVLASLTGGDGVITLYVNGNANSTIAKNTATSYSMPIGEYTIYADYAKGNDSYASAKSNEVIVHVVEKSVQNEITVSVEDVTLPSQVEIKVTALKDGEYTIDVNGSEVKVNVVGGQGSTSIDLTAGSYYANVTGQDNAIITNDVFTVSPEPKKAELRFRDANYPQNITISVENKGNLTITIEYYLESSLSDVYSDYIIFEGINKRVDSPTKDAYTSFTFTVNETSQFTVTAVYYANTLLSGNHEIASEDSLSYSVTIIPLPKDITLNVEVDEEQDENDNYSLGWADYPFEVVTGASEDIDAEIIYKEGDRVLGKAKVDEIFEIDPKDLGLGEHTITAILEGSDDYNEATYTFTLNVYKTIIWYKLTIDNVTYPDHAVGKFYSETDGNYSIIINGESYNVEYEWDENNSVVSFDINELPVGTYTVSNISFEDMEHYEFGESEIKGQNTLPTFSVIAETALDDTVLSIVNGTSPVFSIDLPGATGNFTVTVDGKNYTKELVDGKATVEIDDLPAGDYPATVTYTGDETHKAASVPASFKVEKKTADADTALDVNIPSGSTNPVFAISLPNATGNLTVTIGNKTYTKELVNGSASITVDDLTPGSYNVTVSYSGDKNYGAISKSSQFTVPTPKLTAKNVVAIYSAKATYKVLVTVDGKAVSDEKVAIKFNGKTYQVKTDKNGYATLNLNTKIKVKSYAITAEFKGVKVSNKVTVKHLIKAKNIKAKKSKKVLKINVKTEKVNGKFLKGKKLKLKLKGKTLNAKINKKGVATFKVKKNILKKLKVGKKYKYKVTYGKDAVTKKITVKR